MASTIKVTNINTPDGSGNITADRPLTGGGTWNLIGTNVASSSASLTQTGLDSTYDTYAIVLADIVPATDEAIPYLRVGDSSGIDSGASDYAYHAHLSNEGSTSYSAVVSAGATFMRIGSTAGSASGEGSGGVLFLNRPGDGTMKPFITGTMGVINQSGNYTGGAVMCARTSVITLDRIQFLFSTGNVASGRMTIFGIAHA